MGDQEIPYDILRAFGLVGTTKSKRLAGGATPNISALTEKAGTYYVFRCCCRDNRAERLQFLAEFQQHLLISNIPVPRLMMSQDGQIYACLNGQYWQAYEFLDGNEYDFNNFTHLNESARWLGSIHETSHFFLPHLYEPYDSTLEWWWTNPQQTLATFRNSVAPSMNPSDLTWLPEVSNLFESSVQTMIRWLPLEAFMQLPRVWTHGDYHGGNVKFRANQLIGIFDFDQVDLRPRIYDVAYALLMFTRQARGNYLLRTDAMDSFLRMYESVASPLSAQERSAIPAMMIASQLPDVGLLTSIARYNGQPVGEIVHYWEKVSRAILAQSDFLRQWSTVTL